MWMKQYFDRLIAKEGSHGQCQVKVLEWAQEWCFLETKGLGVEYYVHNSFPEALHRGCK